MNVIVVDDEEIMREGMGDVLRRCLPDIELSLFAFPGEALGYAQSHMVDIAFLDIELPEISGITLAKRMKEKNPHLNVIFVTGYERYAVQAYKVRPSGYLVKPVAQEDVEEELTSLRYPVAAYCEKGIYAVTFGKFRLLVDGKEVKFGRKKSTELFAGLIDRGGRQISRKEIYEVLFEQSDYDRKAQKYLQTILTDMKQSLRKAGAADILEIGRNSFAVDTNKFGCDRYDYERGKASAINSFCGIYMQDYSWGEFTLGTLYGGRL